MTIVEELPASSPRDATPPSMQDSVDAVAALRRDIVGGPDPEATRRQSALGKLTARERIDLLLDEDSFVEIEAFRRHTATGFGIERRRPYTDGVVAGWGTVFGRTIFVYAHDFRIFGGALGRAHAEKIHKVMDMAESAGAPLVALCDGAGARIQEGANALAGFGEIFRRNVRNSGVIPQISVILGPCAGGAAYSPALTDFVFVVRDTAKIFLTGPDVVHAVTGESVSMEELGGARVHSEVTGLASFVYDNEHDCLSDVRYLLSLLPSNCRECPPANTSNDPVDRTCEGILDIVPVDGSKSYDVREVIEVLVDDGEYFEIHERYARNVVCALARLGGETVGVVANQPEVMAGALDGDASVKAARFVSTCDAFNIPLLTLVDIPGFLPGVQQEYGGIIRHGAKLLYAYCNATVPKIQVILRKAYGGAYIVMNSRSTGADFSFAWPTNEIAVMGAEAAANVIFKREIASSPDPESARLRLVDEYRAELMHPLHAAEHGLVDDVIDPAHTRTVLIRALAALRSKRANLVPRKHGNPPQ